MKIFLFDLETTGLPSMKSYNKYYPYQKLEYYESSRIVQLAILVYSYDNNKFNLLEEHNYIVKPDNFKINNSDIHRITQKHAEEHGMKFKDIIDKIIPVLKESNLIVSHNILFDKNVLLSELHRYDFKEAIKTIEKIPCFCTSMQTKDITKLKIKNFSEFKQPKLSELYKFLFKKNTPDNMHDASVDVKILAECFFKLLEKKYFVLD